MPEEFMGDVIGDLNSRRGQIEGMDNRNGTQVVRAFVPLASMFGYVTDLRSMTQGRATSSMEFSHYAEVPAEHRPRAGPEVEGLRRPSRTVPARRREERTSDQDGQEEVRAHQAPRQRRHHRSHRPWQDDA